MAKEKKIVYKVEVKTDEASKGLNKLDKSVDNTSKSTDMLGKSMGSFGGIIGKIPALFKTATAGVKAFGVAVKANPVGLLLVALGALVGLIGVVLSKFQPLVDFISDKFAMMSGVINSFILNLQSVGDVISKVFSGDFKGAIDSMGDMATNMKEVGVAAEELNKVLRDYEVQQKLNDATSAEVLSSMKQLEGVYKDQGKSIEERKEAFEEYYAMKKAQAEDDLAAQQKVTDAEIKLFNATYKTQVTNATEINEYIKSNSNAREDGLKVMDSIIKTTQLEGKVAEESSKKALEANRLRTQGLTEQLGLIKARLGYYEATNKSILEGEKVLTQELIDEETERLNTIKNKKIAAAKKQFDIQKMEYAGNANKLKTLELKYATDVINIKDSTNKQILTNEEKLTKQIADEIKKKKVIEKKAADEKTKADNLIAEEKLKQLAKNQAILLNTYKKSREKQLEDDWKAAKLDIKNSTLNLKEKEDALLVINQQYQDDLKEIEDEAAKLRAAKSQDDIAMVQEGLFAIQELFNAASEIELNKSQEKYDKEQSIVDEKYSKEEAALQKKLKSGLINQAKYDLLLGKLNEAKAKEEADLLQKQEDEENAIKKKAFQKNKAFQMAGIVMDTASALIGIQAGYAPFLPIGSGAMIAQMITTGAMGAASLAQVAATQYTAATGGLISGDLHAQSSGGVRLSPNIMAEGGEFVVNRASTEQYKPLLDAVNGAGNGNGDSSNVSDIIDYDRLASAINDKKVYIVSSEITDQQNIDKTIITNSQF